MSEQSLACKSSKYSNFYYRVQSASTQYALPFPELLSLMFLQSFFCLSDIFIQYLLPIHELQKSTRARDCPGQVRAKKKAEQRPNKESGIVTTVKAA